MTTIPDRPMNADLARYQVRALLDRLTQWSDYAAGPVTDPQHAQDKLQTLAIVLRNAVSDIVDRWDGFLVDGRHPSWRFESDPSAFPLWVGQIEDRI